MGRTTIRQEWQLCFYNLLVTEVSVDQKQSQKVNARGKRDPHLDTPGM